MPFPMIHGIPGMIDCSEMTMAILELNSLTRSHAIPQYLRERLERLNRPPGPVVELPPEDGGAPVRLGPSPELLCILATLRALHQ